MYRIEKAEGRTIVYDWNEKVVYSSPDDAYIAYTPQVGLSKGNLSVVKVGSMSETQLHTALANAVKLSL